MKRISIFLIALFYSFQLSAQSEESVSKSEVELRKYISDSQFSKFKEDNYNKLFFAGGGICSYSESSSECRPKVLNSYQSRLNTEIEIQKKKTAFKMQADAANSRLKSCLSSDKIPVCSINTLAPMYKCGQVWEKGYNWEGSYEWHDKLCNDNANVIVTFVSKNNLKSQVKDIVFTCESIAKSGTVIGSKEVQVFDSWTPGSSKEVSITIPRINQTDSLRCFAKSWK